MVSFFESVVRRSLEGSPGGRRLICSDTLTGIPYTTLPDATLTTEIAREVETLRDLHAELVKVDSADQAHVLARHLSGLMHQRLADEKDPDRRLALAKKLLASINGDAPTFAEPVRQLHAVRNQPAPGLLARYQGRPKTPLNDAALLTNAHGEPNLGSLDPGGVRFGGPSGRSAVRVREVARPAPP